MRLRLFSIALTLTSVATLHAATITYVSTLAPAAVASNTLGIRLATNPATTIEQFDPALGILNSATITLDIVYDATIHTGSNGGAGSISSLGQISIDGITVDATGGVAGKSGGANKTLDYIFHPVHSTTVTAASNASAFAALEGAGTANWLWSANLGITSIPNLFSSGFSQSLSLTSGSVSVAYDFTPAPEPAQALPMALGLGVLLLFGRSAVIRNRSKPAVPKA